MAYCLTSYSSKEWTAELTSSNSESAEKRDLESSRLCLTILPLILLLTRSLDHIHANHLPQLHEPRAPE
jgi:hypothetical protein